MLLKLWWWWWCGGWWAILVERLLVRHASGLGLAFPGARLGACVGRSDWVVGAGVFGRCVLVFPTVCFRTLAVSRPPPLLPAWIRPHLVSLMFPRVSFFGHHHGLLRSQSQLGWVWYVPPSFIAELKKRFRACCPFMLSAMIGSASFLLICVFIKAMPSIKMFRRLGFRACFDPFGGPV